jgi:hypothetical protein
MFTSRQLAASVFAFSMALSAGCACRDAPPKVKGAAPVTAAVALQGIAPLGRAPLCEPSAALVAPWDSGAILVADNEIRDRLFVFTRQGEAALGEPLLLPMPSGGRPRDIEALVGVGQDVLVIGSQSRNRNCKRRERRSRLRQLRWEADTKQLVSVHAIDAMPVWDSALLDETTCERLLFTTPSPKHAAEVCQALVGASRDPERCETQNVEGAVALAGRVWLGLRSPLVGQRAVLLRLVWPAETLKFDAVSLIDLGGDGVREMTMDAEGSVWGISGPPLDSDRAFRTWHVSAAQFAADPTPALGPEVPTSSEGLLVTPEGILTVIDGAEGDTDEACAVPARQFRAVR